MVVLGGSFRFQWLFTKRVNGSSGIRSRNSANGAKCSKSDSTSSRSCVSPVSCCLNWNDLHGNSKSEILLFFLHLPLIPFSSQSLNNQLSLGDLLSLCPPPLSLLPSHSSLILCQTEKSLLEMRVKRHVCALAGVCECTWFAWLWWRKAVVKKRPE